MFVSEPYVLITPTYELHDGVPHQVRKFLRDPGNRRWCQGVVSTGNRNFAGNYGIAGGVLSKELQVPWLMTVEISGTKSDVEQIRKEVEQLTSDQLLRA